MDTPTIQEVKDRTWIPFTLTVAWFVFAGFVLYSRRDALACIKLNEIGDALAGFFSPVAFLWLVFGYLQQGKELKLSSDALRFQALELSKSVLQQQELVKVGQEELAISRAEQHNARDREKDFMRPTFLLASHTPIENQYKTEIHRYTLRNSGETVKNLTARITGNFKTEHTATSLIRSKSELEMEIMIPKGESPNEINFEIDYELVNGDLERQIGNGIKRGATFHCSSFRRTLRPVSN